MKSPDYWQQAIDHLSEDLILADIIFRYEGETLRSRGEAFETLLRAIVGQQISVKAADSVWKKLVALLPQISPEFLLKLSVPQLRSAGLSERKALYAIDLSQHFVSQKIRPEEWHHLGDEEIIAQLVQVKGIGRWSAEMFLIFYLLRPNILPVGDLGLQKAISLHYGTKYPMDEKSIHRLTKHWHPYCTVATWFLWRALDPIPIEY